MLTAEEIEAAYDELKSMYVPLRSEPELGLSYIKERLGLCRAMQDRLSELRLSVNRHYTDVLERSLIAKGIVEIQPTPDTKKAARELEVVKQRHAMLAKMIGLQMQVLGRTSMDIRLLADLTKQQIQRGEINPHESPDIIRDVDPSEMVPQEPTAPAVVDMAPPSTTGGAIANVSFDEPVASKPDDRVKLADTGAIDFDSLFGGLPHGSPTSSNPF